MLERRCVKNKMKKLIGLFSTKGKTPEQISEEVMQALAKDKITYKATWNEPGSGVSCLFYTVIIKFDAITAKYPGGFAGFEEKHKGGLQTDGELISIIFMGQDYHYLLKELVKSGLEYSESKRDFCLYEPPFFSRFSGGRESYINFRDSIEYSFRGEGKERKVWAKLKKLVI